MTLISQSQLRLKETQNLIAEKDAIDIQIQEHEAILRQQNVDMKTALVDSDGFPRADLDIYVITHARSELAKLYNDLKVKMGEIQVALESYHAAQKTELVTNSSRPEVIEAIPFARVHTVADGSPAMEAGLLPGDLIYKFGDIDFRTVNGLQMLGTTIASYEFKTIRVYLIRDGSKELLMLIPHPWTGRGLLGCHLLPC